MTFTVVTKREAIDFFVGSSRTYNIVLLNAPRQPITCSYRGQYHLDIILFHSHTTGDLFQLVLTPSSPSAPSIDIEIPCALKLKLEDDCYFIKRKKKVRRYFEYGVLLCK